MGNKLQRKRSNALLTPRNSTGSTSLTIPSMCTSPSYNENAKTSSSTNLSDTFTWNQMKSLYMRQEHLTIDNLSPLVLRMAYTGFDVLKRQLGEICGDLQSGILKMPEGIVERFAIHCNKNKNSSQAQMLQFTPSMTALLTKKIIVHFVTMLYFHEMILNHFRTGDTESALDLIKQLVVSHALMGVSTAEFRLMDWFLANYLYTNKITSDEVMNNLVLYLNTVSNYVTQFFITQSIRYYSMHTLLLEKKNDRENKARENFRLMKRWKNQLQLLSGREQLVELLLNEQTKLRQTEEDQTSVDSLALKQNDWIMKHFVKTPDVEKRP